MKLIKTAILLTLILTLVTGFIYPVLVTVFAQIFFPHQANGSLITKNNIIIGSSLIGQNFEDIKYFHGRPSESNYDGTMSGGSNLGPTNKKLINKIISNANKLKKENPNISVPVDLLTESGSGLDPHITLEAALFQSQRVAMVRNVRQEKVLELIKKHTEQKTFHLLGEQRVNVLKLNLALDDTVKTLD